MALGEHLLIIYKNIFDKSFEKNYLYIMCFFRLLESMFFEKKKGADNALAYLIKNSSFCIILL